jgi:mRNA interferase MazF
LCQITSNPYGDPASVALTVDSFAEGGLPRESFVRPAKVFTASQSIVVRSAARLTARAHRTVVEAIVNVLEATLK